MRKTSQHFRDQISSLGIPKRDTVGLRVTNRAPAGFNTVNGQFVNNGKKYGPYERTMTIVGLYVADGMFSNKGDVHVVKDASVFELVHEIGHHITLTLNDQSGIEEKLNIIMNQFKGECIHRYGLRSYSFTNWKELLADCYAVRYTGPSKWWANLVNFFGKHGVDLVAATAA